MSLRHQAVSGVAWSTAARVGQQVVQFAVSIVLARLLLPEAYGIMGMVAVFMGFASLFAEFGFSPALVQRQDLQEIHAYSVFWVGLLVGTILTGIFFFASPLIADFYGMPLLEPVGRALSLTFVVSAIGIVPRALLQKRMDFKALAQLEFYSALLPGAVAIVLALRGLGVWSLVAHNLLVSGLSVWLAWSFCGWWPRLRFSRVAVGELFGYSANLFGFSFINFWARNLDDLLIGKVIGSAALGIYSRSYSLMLLPISQVIDVIGRVIFPVLSAIQHDKERVRQVYLKAMSLIALVSFPLMIGLIAVARPFVLALLGPGWIDAVPVLQILCLVGILQSLCNPTGWLYTSQGRTDWMFRWGIGGSGALIACILVGASFGTVRAVTLAYLVGNLLVFYPCIMIPGKLVGMTVADVLAHVRGALACSLVMGLSVWGLAWALPPAWPHGLSLAVLVTFGIVTYVILVAVVHPRGYDELVDLVPAGRGSRLLPHWALSELGRERGSRAGAL